LREAFGLELCGCIARIGESAAAEGVAAYLVGGAVRDALRRQRSVDIDLMIEGDAASFVRTLFADWSERFPDTALPKKPVVFKKYGTAKLLFPVPLCGTVDELDFSSARKERYPIPGQAPEIESGDLESDLSRRDFTINALAVDIRPTSFGALVDCFGGIEHLQHGLLSVMHKDSFRDDPARLLRAVRFMVRFGFAMEPETRRLFGSAVTKNYLGTLPPFRLFDEFRKALDEAVPYDVAVQLDEYGLLSQVHQGLVVTPRYLQLMKNQWQEKGSEALWLRRFSALSSELSDEEFQEMIVGFGLRGDTSTMLSALRERSPYSGRENQSAD
jgi:tRNA nucleotidyltransferase (CCA-adding enzyme)